MPAEQWTTMGGPSSCPDQEISVVLEACVFLTRSKNRSISIAESGTP